MKSFYPVAKPIFHGNEKKYVSECMDTTWISSKGKFIDLFENEFASYLGVKHAIAVSNGTVALHLALLAGGIKPGDEVIIPTFTYVATANAVVYIGATPVFVDCDPEIWCINVDQIEAKITHKTKAIIPVHIYGHPTNMQEIMRIAKKHNLFVIEDAAESHGAKIGNQYTGTIGDVSTFSFFGNKTITTGEGGMLTTNDDDLAYKIRILKGQGMDPNNRYWFTVVGYNYRMTNIQAAIGLAQLECIDWHLAQRRRVAEYYHAFLENIVDLATQPEKNGFVNSYWMNSALILNNEIDRDTVMDKLYSFGVDSRPFFYPMHVLPMYKIEEEYEKYPVANRISKYGISLPTSADLQEEDVQYICDSLIKVIQT